MGCDIHPYIEVFDGKDWNEAEISPRPLHYVPKWDKTGEFKRGISIRDYGLFGFLANVRNYSHVPYIAEPRGLPADSIYKEDENIYYYHSHSYLTLKELLDFNYNQVFWNRRVTKQIAPNCFDGTALAEEGEGTHLTIREFLGEWFFKELDRLSKLDDNPANIRLVFWFDN